MRFNRLDLNLLVALDALLTERSVSLAADRICLSQSATSSALGRLREYFGDELLVVKGRQMVLTPRGEGLIEPVAAVLEQIRSSISVAPPFNPATTDRTLRLMASDYATQVFLGQALNGVGREAPMLRFEILPPQDELIEALERGEIDLLFSLDHGLSTEHPMRELFQDDYVVVGSRDNPKLREPLSCESFLTLGHVAVEFGRQRVHSFEEIFLRRRGMERRIEVVAPSFLAVPSLLVGSQRVALLQRRLAMQAIRTWPLKMVESPVAVPPIRQAVQWHRSSKCDPAVLWLVDQLERFAQAEDEKPAANVVSIGQRRALDGTGNVAATDQPISANVSAHQSAM